MLEQPVAAGEMSPVINPAEPKDIVGYVREATPREGRTGAGKCG